MEKSSSKSRFFLCAVSGSDRMAYSTKGLWSNLHHLDEFMKRNEVKKGHEDEEAKTGWERGE